MPHAKFQSLCVLFPRLCFCALIAQFHIANIENEFQELKTMTRQNKELKKKLQLCSTYTTFEEGRALVEPNFEELKKFCRGLATAFPSRGRFFHNQTNSEAR